MCPHIWLIRPHIWLIQILSECAPIFGLFAPIFGLFANSRNSAPMFGLFSSKFAASLFWPDGTTWYRRISTYLGSSPKLTAPSLAPFSDKFPDRLAANRSTRQRDLITNCFALLSPPSGRHRCERVEAITPEADLIAHCVVVVVTGDHSTSFRESGGHSLSRPYHNRPVKHAFVELALHHTTGFLLPRSLPPSLRLSPLKMPTR